MNLQHAQALFDFLAHRLNISTIITLILRGMILSENLELDLLLALINTLIGVENLILDRSFKLCILRALPITCLF